MEQKCGSRVRVATHDWILNELVIELMWKGVLAERNAAALGICCLSTRAFLTSTQ
jgi:hypothetical protein